MKTKHKIGILIVCMLLFFIGRGIMRARTPAERLKIDLPPRPSPSPNAFARYSAVVKALKDKKGIEATYRAAFYDPEKKVPTASTPLKLPLSALEKHVRQNRAVLKQIRQAFREDYYEPEAQSLSQPDAPWDHYTDIAKLFMLEGRIKAARGDHAGAMKCYLDAVRMGEQIQHGAVVIGGLVGTACCAIGRRGAWPTIDRLNAKQSIEAARRIEGLLSLHVPFSDLLIQEKRLVLRTYLEHFKKHDRGEEEYYEEEGSGPSETHLMILYGRQGLLDHYSAVLDKMIANNRLPFPSRKRSFSAASENPWVRRAIYMMDPVRSDLASVFELPSLKESVNLTQSRLLMARLALHAYHLEQRRYPRQLSDLVPRYLRAVPTDPFTAGQPLRYHLKGQKLLIYSVGPDGSDDGGQAIDNPDEDAPPDAPARRFVRVESRGDIVAGVNIY